jgi:diguanylate cyclase (GGDEF)-like protein
VPGSDIPAGGSGDVPAVDHEQVLADREQSLADSDQTLADSSQTAADRDELASVRDQLAADADQRSADQEHAARDPAVDDVAYTETRRSRFQSTLDRDLSSEARSESAQVRDLNAQRRDAVADQRDRTARERDEILAQLDREEEPLLRAVRGREYAAGLRDRMHALREAAASDRQAAATDRRRAARDREDAAAELAEHGLDHLTGSLRRRAGMAAIEREMDRTARSGEPLVIAFVDVDGLKATNDADGHQAGDDLLRTVVECVRHDLRSYDLVVRYGGDEFVCSMSGQPGPEVERRFEEIAAVLRATSAGSFSVGIAERGSDESLEELIGRADAAMLSTREASD